MPRPSANRPIVHAVAMSRLPYALGSITRRAFTGRESFLLESAGIPIAAIVSAREWLGFLETKFPGAGPAIERKEFGSPYVRPEKRPVTTRRAKKAPRRPRTKRKGRTR